MKKLSLVILLATVTAAGVAFLDYERDSAVLASFRINPPREPTCYSDQVFWMDDPDLFAEPCSRYDADQAVKAQNEAYMREWRDDQIDKLRNSIQAERKRETIAWVSEALIRAQKKNASNP